MDVITVRLPLRAVHEHGIGPIGGETTSVLLRLETDTGLVGWGEAAPWAVFTGTPQASAAALDAYIRPLLIGADPFRVPTLMTAAEQAVVHCTEAKAALETALLDLVGRALNTPLCDLIGGRFRAEIPLSVSIADPDFDADLELAAGLVADGVRLFKVKTGVSGHRRDLERIERLRQVLPDDAEIRADYNQGLAAPDALRALRDLDRLELGFIEQPVRRDQIHALAMLTAALDTPVMADEAVFSAADMLGVVRIAAADMVSIKLMKHGGFSRAREIAGIAAAAGLSAYAGSMIETGIASAAGAHLVAATPAISLGCEFYQPTYYLADDILVDPFPVRDGKVHVPFGPGLGITVDEGKVAKYRVQ